MDHDHSYKLLFSHPRMMRDLLEEFQSAIEPFMTVRVLTYVGLLYQDLIRAREITVERGLPAVLPIVVYNGQVRWRAASETPHSCTRCLRT